MVGDRPLSGTCSNAHGVRNAGTAAGMVSHSCTELIVEVWAAEGRRKHRVLRHYGTSLIE